MLRLFENTIYLPAKIVSFFGILMFGESPRKLLIAYPFYIIGTIFMGAFLGYLISKKRAQKINEDQKII